MRKCISQNNTSAFPSKFNNQLLKCAQTEKPVAACNIKHAQYKLNNIWKRACITLILEYICQIICMSSSSLGLVSRTFSFFLSVFMISSASLFIFVPVRF